MKQTPILFLCTSVFFLVAVTGVLAQPCNPYPGYTTWMGYTNAWEDSVNWCPAIVPVNGNPAMNVRIPGGPSGPYLYHRPVIGQGVNALCNKLRVESSDTIHIAGAVQSSLTVTDSMKILNATSAVIVNNPNVDSVQLVNGTINLPEISPLNSHNRTRSFLLITQAELLAQGMQPGDVVCRILIHIQRKSNGEPYRNFTVRYYHTTVPGNSFGTGYTASIPPPLTPGVLTVWNGDLDASSFIPTINNYGTIAIDLQTPIVWSGANTSIVIEFCYDNTGFPDTGANDEPRFTATGSLNQYLSIQARTNFIKPGCDLLPNDTIAVNASWSPGSNLILVTNPAQLANVLPGMITYPEGRTIVSILGMTLMMDSILTTSGSNTSLVLSHVKVISEPFRPNVTLVLNCNDGYKFPIYVGGHWENNGTFVPGISRVHFNGTINNQQVGGQSQTTFYDADIDNPNHVIRLTDFTVIDSLSLTQGRLKLNNGMATLLYASPSAITRTFGFIQSETDLLSANVYPFGRIYWKMGPLPGASYWFPFVNSVGSYIPVYYNAISGTHDVVLGTYGTNSNNTNLPLPEVTNVIGFSNGTFNSSGDNTVDRFYFIHDSLGINPNAQLLLHYTHAERAVINPSGVSVMCAQQWINNLDMWTNQLLAGQVYIMGSPADRVELNIPDSVFDTADWWTISTCTSLLGTSVSEINIKHISVYPNPAYAGDIMNFILSDNNFIPDLIRIYSTDGREVFREYFDKGISSFKVPDLQQGMYTLHLENSEKSSNVKLIILE